MYEPNPQVFDSRLVQQIVTQSIYNQKSTSTPAEADELLFKIITDLYYAGYKPFICGILGLTIEDYIRLKNLSSIKKMILEINMSFVFINVLVGQFFTPSLLID